MMLASGDKWNQYALVLEPTEGPHTLALTLRHNSEENTYPLRPDEALALAAVLEEWALERSEKEGLF